MIRTPLRAAIATALVGSGLIAQAATARVVVPPTTLVPGTLTVCTYPGFAPFTSFTGKGAWVGWDASFLTAFATQQGLAVKPVPVDPFDGMWTLARLRSSCCAPSRCAGAAPSRVRRTLPAGR